MAVQGWRGGLGHVSLRLVKLLTSRPTPSDPVVSTSEVVQPQVLLLTGSRVPTTPPTWTSSPSTETKTFPPRLCLREFTTMRYLFSTDA